MSYLGRSAKLSLKAQEKVSFLATAGQTVKAGLSYVPSFVEVYVNGVLLTDTTDFTATNGNSITFTVALLLNDEVTVISLKTFTVADHYTKSEADTLLAAKATNTALALKAPIASPAFTGGIGVTGSTVHTEGDVKNTIAGTYKLFGANGTAGSNSYVTYCFEGDNDTGMNRTGNNNLQLVTAGAAAIKIDAAGIVTKPYQPAFQASKGTNTTIADATWTTLIFDNERFDNNADYNPSNGVFTAPVTGRYQMNFSARIDNISHSVAHASVQFTSSNRDYSYQSLITPTAYDSTLNYTTFPASALIDMDSGDTVKCTAYIQNGTGTHVAYAGNIFSGYLVC